MVAETEIQINPELLTNLFQLILVQIRYQEKHLPLIKPNSMNTVGSVAHSV